MKPRSSSKAQRLVKRTRTRDSQMPNLVMNKRESVITIRVTRFCRFFAKTVGLALWLAAGFASHAAEKLTPAPPAREAIEWCDIWISHANETNLPRVLLIGDSIVRDYYPEVEKRLAGKAFVARLSTSRFVADPVLHKE